MTAARRESRHRFEAAVTRGDAGQATVELAMVLPLVVLLLLLVAQVALVARDQVAVVHAAREAARAAAVAERVADRGAAATRGARASGSFDPDEIDVRAEPVEGGRRIRATVRYTVRTNLPLVGALVPDVDLVADAVMRVEQP